MSDMGWHMVAALRHESVSHDELSDSSVCSSSDDWGFVVTVFGLREHHGVRERFGLQDLVLELGSDNALVKASESVSCKLTLAGSNIVIDSWLVVTGFGLREHHGCAKGSVSRTLSWSLALATHWSEQLNPCFARYPSRGATKPWIHG